MQGTDVISAALYLTYTGTNTARDFKVNVTLSVREVGGGECYQHSSCVYYLTREGPPDATNPRQETSLSHFWSRWTTDMWIAFNGH